MVERELSASRVVGAVIVVIGVLVINFGDRFNIASS
jgi:hypothetical protein